MKGKENKNIAKLVETMMQDSSLETTSFDFTSRVMTEVGVIQRKKSDSYKPVISKRAWLIIFTVISGFVVWLILTQKETSANSNFNFINTATIFKFFNGFQFSGITNNILLVAMAMILFQIILLKKYLHKRYHE
jgi:hypothetical protein